MFYCEILLRGVSYTYFYTPSQWTINVWWDAWDGMGEGGESVIITANVSNIPGVGIGDI